MIGKNIKNLTKTGGNLSQRTVRGSFWVFFLRIVQQIFGLTRLLILARILAPHDFGLMGIALLTMSTLETFSQTGFQVALIQKKRDITSYLDAAWTVLILRGIVIFGILYFTAPFVASFFNTPEAKSIIQVIGFSVLFQAFNNIGIIYFQKELEFNKEFIYQFTGTLADFIVSISAVLILKNVWALVFGILAGKIVRCFVSYLCHPYRPRLSRDLEKAKELFGFGKWVLGSSIFTFLLVQGDDILVGKVLGASALGFYQMAYKISNMPATEISHLIAKVTFPVYSKIQGNLQKLRELYLNVLQLTTFLSIPIAGIIFLFAHDFTIIFLGEKWLPMVSVMQVLAIYGALRAIGATTGVVFLAVGQPEISTKIKFAQLIVMSVLIYPFTIHWGILGTSMAVITYAFIFNFVAVGKVFQIINTGFRNLVMIIIFPLVNTIIMICTILTVKTFIYENTIDVTSFSLLIIIGLFIYLIVDYIFGRAFNYGNIRLIQNQFKYFTQKHGA